MSVSQIVLCTDRLPDCKSLSHWTLWTVHWTKNTPRHRFPVMIVIRLDDLYTVCKKSYIFICPKFAKAAFDFINEIFIWCDIYVATNLWQKHYINTSLLLVYHFFLHVYLFYQLRDGGIKYSESWILEIHRNEPRIKAMASILRRRSEPTRNPQ